MKNPAARIKIDGKSVKKPTVVVGSKTVLTGVSAPKDSAITFKSSDKTIATVDADGTLTALKAGTVNIAATNALGAKYVINVTVKAFDFQSVKQTKAAELEVVLAGDTKGLGASSVKITNTSNNVNYAVKSFAVDKNDPTKATITTYQDMKDGKEYKVVIGDTEKTFVATDGVVAAVGLEKNTVVVATETKVNAQTMDANGVVLSTVEYPGADSIVIEVNNISNNGYITSNGLYLDKVGDTATVDIVYHSGKYDTNGTETGNVEARNLLITAVDAASIDGWSVKVGGSGSSYATVKETKLAVNDTGKSAYIQMTDSAKATSVDISNYTVESSDVDTLIVSQSDDTDTNGEIGLTPLKVGTAYLVIKDEKTQSVFTTIPVAIVAERKAVSLTLDKTSVSLTQGLGIVDDADVNATLKDQYGENLSVNGASVVSSDTDVATVTSTVADGKFTVTAVESHATEKKTATVTVTYDNGTVKLEKKLAVNVAAPATGTANGLAVDVSATKVDAVIKADATANTAITVKAFDTANGAKQAFHPVIGDTEITLKKGNVTYKVTSTSSSAVVINPIKDTMSAVKVLDVTSSGAITLNVNDLSTGWKLEAGAYTLEVKATVGGTSKTVTKTIVVTDTQPKVTVSRVKASANTVTNCFEVSYDGKKLENPDVIFYNVQGTNVTELSGSVPVAYAVVTTKVGNNTLVQKVNIGLTVRVE